MGNHCKGSNDNEELIDVLTSDSNTLYPAVKETSLLESSEFLQLVRKEREFNQ